MRDKGEIFATLVHIAEKNDIRVQLFPEFPGVKGRLRGKRIGLRSKLDIDEMNYTLAHELAHYYLHFDKGDTVNSDRRSEYEEQAERAAWMILDALAG